MTAPTTGLGLTLPTPRSASSIARARCSWSVSVRCTGRLSLDQPRVGPLRQAVRPFRSLPAPPALQPVDLHDRPGALVGQRVEVEGPVEVERHRARALAVGRGLEGERRALL